MKIINLFVALFVLAGLFVGCDVSSPPDDALKATLDPVTVKKYVAIGNSLSAGYQSNGLYHSAQMYAFPNLIAKQLTLAGAQLGTFEMPWYSDPGTPISGTTIASRYEIISLTGPVIRPRGVAAGAPENSSLTRPYDNLGIPGAVLFDFLDTTAFAVKAGAPRSNPLFLLVLRQAALGKTIFAQTKALNPDLVTFWLGNNDVLGFATSGGVSPSAPTNSAIFQALYAQALDSLRTALPNAKIVVANIPDVRSIPFFNTVGPKMAAGIPTAYWLRYQKHGNASVAFDSTKLTEAGAPLICLTGMSYASLLGQPTGQWYRDKGYAPPAGIDTTKPFGFHPQNPWPDALILDATEQTTAGDAVTAFNTTIATVASAKGAAVVDINTFFKSIKANGITVGASKYTADYVSGGIFSLDGVHPSNRGAGIVANEFLRVINAKWGCNIPYIDVNNLPGIPLLISKAVATGMPQIPADAFNSLEMLWGGSAW
jgi:lysophospholipase L1-like esterase